VSWFLKGANLSDPEATFNLGYLHLQGEGGGETGTAQHHCISCSAGWLHMLSHFYVVTLCLSSSQPSRFCTCW
jgi:hypothetical protein